MQAEKTLYLVRGIPGAGKSTFAETLARALDCIDFYEADDWFYTNDVYNFDPSQVHRAHQWCQDIADRAMREGDPNVIISNTFTREKELKPYLDSAAEHGYRVVSLIVENRHGNKSVHDVPDETVEKMRNRFSVKL